MAYGSQPPYFTQQPGAQQPANQHPDQQPPGYPQGPSYPQHPQLKYRGVGRRFLALLLDTILLTLVFSTMAEVYKTQGRQCSANFFIGVDSTLNGVESFYGLCGYPALAYFIFVIGYYVAFEWLLKGTPGKLATGLRVTTLEGRRIGLGASAIRNLLRIVDVLPGCIPYLVGAILIWTSPQKQRLGDRAANTVVVSRGRK